jgi:hypothetical protein
VKTNGVKPNGEKCASGGEKCGEKCESGGEKGGEKCASGGEKCESVWVLEILERRMRIDYRVIYGRCLALEESQRRLAELMGLLNDYRFGKQIACQKKTLTTSLSVVETKWKTSRQMERDVNSECDKVMIDLAVAESFHKRLLDEINQFRPDLMYWLRHHIQRLTVHKHVWVRGSNADQRPVVFYRALIVRLDNWWDQDRTLVGNLWLRKINSTQNGQKTCAVRYIATYPDILKLDQLAVLPSPTGDSTEQTILRTALFQHDPPLFVS